jgi:hypothetical protein
MQGCKALGVQGRNFARFGGFLGGFSFRINLHQFASKPEDWRILYNRIENKILP